MGYLTELYNKGSSYSSIGLARSALSSFVVLENNKSIGVNPLITRFMRGVFNKRPPKPRYQEIWDVKPVLNYLRTQSPVKFLHLKELTLKLCCLLALLTAQRSQTLSLLSLDNMKRKGNIIVFIVNDLLKQSRPGHVGLKVELKGYPPDRRLCVKTVLDEYLQRTFFLRKDEKKLFISYRKPHDAVTKDTIARWVRTVLSAAGVNVDVFKAHSTRAAATSAANSKFVPIHDIIKTAGWAGDKTFQRFYNKPLHRSNAFAEAILNL